MPRIYKKAVGARSYRNYTDETLEKALIEVVEGRMSQAEAARHFKISLGTINNKYKGKHIQKFGGQTVLTADEEAKLVLAIKVCGEWGFPLTTMDIRLMTKRFLTETGKYLTAS